MFDRIRAFIKQIKNTLYSSAKFFHNRLLQFNKTKLKLNFYSQAYDKINFKVQRARGQDITMVKAMQI